MTTEHEKMLITKYDLLFESRLTKVEVTLTNLSEDMIGLKTEIKEIRKDMRSDFKWMLSSFAGLALVLSGLMAHGFKWF